MSQIPPLDYSFLLLESEESPKHVGPVEIMQPPEGASADYVSQFVAKLRQRKPAPPFNYKLKVKLPNLLSFIPGLPSDDVAIPQWRVTSSVDMERHVLHHVLPQPGDTGQLMEKLLELHKVVLKRDRPLWECHVIEGFEGGRRFAVYTKVHHSIIDGMMATTLFAINSSSVPGPDAGKAFWELPEGWTAPELSGNSRIGVKDLLKSLIESSSLTGEMYMSVLKSGVGALLKSGSKGKTTGILSAPITRLDKSPTAGRRLVFDRIPLDRVKYLSKAAGVSINNLLLATVDMAFRGYLADFGEEPKKRLVALMPMAMRTEIVDASEGNSVIIVPVKLGRAKAAPIDRLRDIVKETELQKEVRDHSSDSAMASAFVMAGLSHIGESLNLAGSVAPLGNFVFSNVPGPREKRYRFDAQIDEIYPVSCLVPGMTLNITTYSYAGQVHFQLIAQEKSVPDLSILMGHVQSAFSELEQAVSNALSFKSKKGAAQPATAKKKAVKTPAKTTASATKPASTKKAAPATTKKKAVKTPAKTAASATKPASVKKAAPATTKKKAVKTPAKTAASTTKSASAKKAAPATAGKETAKTPAKTAASATKKAAPATAGKKAVETPSKAAGSTTKPASAKKATSTTAKKKAVKTTAKAAATTSKSANSKKITPTEAKKKVVKTPSKAAAKSKVSKGTKTSTS